MNLFYKGIKYCVKETDLRIQILFAVATVFFFYNHGGNKMFWSICLLRATKCYEERSESMEIVIKYSSLWKVKELFVYYACC